MRKDFKECFDEEGCGLVRSTETGNKLDESEFLKNYRNSFPDDFMSWLEDFTKTLDCPPPDPNFAYNDMTEYFKRVGAWETQMIIYKKLKYAIKAEKQRLTKQ